MKSTVVDEGLSSTKPMYCSREYFKTSKSIHSCDSAIYFDLGPDIIKNNSDFIFYYNKSDITLIVLDGGNEIILANWPNDKHIICTINNDLPMCGSHFENSSTIFNNSTIYSLFYRSLINYICT